MAALSVSETRVDYQIDPAGYKHWHVSYEGAVATLTLDVREDAGIQPGYKLKLNSYDLGVDIELYDAVQRVRFEHPEIGCVVITGGKPRMFCSGANIYMLGLATHAWKVNFCKFTNETRNGIEDTSRYSGIKFIAACNGATAGGGYELALACDEIILIDDRSSSVSLPEVPLLGVLPGTGGLTRLIDKRRVRRDHADVFCTTAEGIQGQRAKDWRLVDEVVKPQQFNQRIRDRAQELAGSPEVVPGIALTPVPRTIDHTGYHYEFVDARLDPRAHTATLTVRAPQTAAFERSAAWWPLQMSRELDDAILNLRTHQLDLGLWILKTEGDAETILSIDRQMLELESDWFVREVLGMMRRTFARLEVSSRSMYAVIEPGSCFAGSMLELALAADRVYMLDQEGNWITLNEMNFGPLPTVARVPRAPEALRDAMGRRLSATEAMELGLVTFAPDELDWADELRLAMEGRTALSPDALTGLEANLRFASESMETRIFGRLSAWQNWIFSRPNAVGLTGALKVYGTGNRAKFDPERT